MLDQDALEIWVLDTARLVFGSDTEAQAQVPLGDDAELVTREAVPQDVAGTLEVADFGIEIVEAMVVWDGPDVGVQVEDGTALLFLTVDVSSESTEDYLCTSAGDYQITLPDGTGRTADFVPEECFDGGEDIRDLTIGFTIDDLFAGEYDIVIETTTPHPATRTRTRTRTRTPEVRHPRGAGRAQAVFKSPLLRVSAVATGPASLGWGLVLWAGLPPRQRDPGRPLRREARGGAGPHPLTPLGLDATVNSYP